MICPDCGEALKLMYEYPDQWSLEKLFHCEKCLSDWGVVYVQGRIERIQRYYFG